MTSDNLDKLVRFLSLRDHLSSREVDVIKSLPHRIKKFVRHDYLVTAHTTPSESCLVIDGIAARSVDLFDGTRQITAVHVPGDFVDLHAFVLKIMDHNVIALGACEAMFIRHEDLKGVTEEYPHLTRLLWLSTVIDAAIHRAWLTCIGRKSPAQHIAHLLCEMLLRLQAVDLAVDNRFSFPATQSELADMLGLSLVHVNKTMAQLRARKWFTWEGGIVTVSSFEKLAEFSAFDPTYLSLVTVPR